MVVSLEWQRNERVEPAGERPPLTRFHQRLLAETLTAVGPRGAKRVAPALATSAVDLNPHQIEAALFALDALPRGGAVLADEVGLGKTIEAGIVIAQLAAEGKKRILVLTPASLRAQWSDELSSKFGLESKLVDGSKARPGVNPFDTGGLCIASIPFGANRSRDLSRIAWDLVVIDEAHRLRNAYRPNHRTGRALRGALEGRPKLLLTATPMQNELLELFGLLSFIDEKVLGPEQAFRSHFTPTEDGLDEGAARDLRERLDSCVVRTLRRQVREYVQFTHRRSVVEDFAPLPAEADLYEKVSEYLRNSEALAIDPGQRTLLTLVYRKLLASSSFAIAPTLEKLAEGLEKRLGQAEVTAQADAFLATADADTLTSHTEEREEFGTEEDGVRPPPSQEKLRHEAAELREYARLARSVTVNAKGGALTRALTRIFESARKQKWPEKAVIFTESRRTQQYLFDLLSAEGFAGEISVLCGDGSGPEERRALVDEFRNRTKIMLMTDAGAEGLNLQFCNLLVNYDLPWNPQRVEQRIGRCHRYGQTRDVVVVNFVNRSNAADARLYELLEQKLALFDGVFGASDEILGALESGVDFERRILDIYQACRTETEITTAFASLREEMERHIGLRMKKCRSLLLERFDGDVRSRLRLASEQAKQEVQKRSHDAGALTHAVFGEMRRDRQSVQAAARVVKERTSEPISYLQLDASQWPARLQRLGGREAWWFVYRFTLGGARAEERLVHLVLVRDGATFKALPLADTSYFAQAEGREEPTRRAPALSITAIQEEGLAKIRKELVTEISEAVEKDLDRDRERAYRYAEDCLVAPQQAVARARKAWEVARQELMSGEELDLRSRLRANVERLDDEYRKKLKDLRTDEDARYLERDRALEEINKRGVVEERRTSIATAYCFW